MEPNNEDLMGDFIDEFLQGSHSSSFDNTSDEVISVQEVSNLEATPFLPDGTEAIIMVPDVVEVDPKQPKMQPTQDGRILTMLQSDINENRMILQELKSSINVLKVTTLKIEREGREHANSITEINTDKSRLNNILVDLEFQFHERVVLQEETGSPDETVEKCCEVMKKDIGSLFGKMEERLCKLDERMAAMETQLREPREQSPPLAVPTDVSFDVVVKKVEDCVARTVVNDKSIATAWVGLIVSLLLIPIAFLVGKFVSV